MGTIDSFLKESQQLVGRGTGESAHTIAEGGPANAVADGHGRLHALRRDVHTQGIISCRVCSVPAS